MRFTLPAAQTLVVPFCPILCWPYLQLCTQILHQSQLPLLPICARPDAHRCCFHGIVAPWHAHTYHSSGPTPPQEFPVSKVHLAIVWPGCRLVGLCGAEVVSPSAVGASQGFLGSISYIGSSMAGLPLSLILQHYGWGALFTSLIGACGLTVALLLPLLNAQSYTQRAVKTA